MPSIIARTSTLLLLATLLAGRVLAADSIQYLDYQYDAAGNIVGIESSVVTDAPAAVTLSPASVSRGRIAVPVVASGLNLREASVAVDVPGLLIGNVVTTSDEARFDISVPLDAPLGAATFSFTTLLGSTSAQLAITEAEPDLLVEPSPIGIAIDEPPREVRFIMLAPSTQTRTVTLAIADESIATLSSPLLTFAPGETEQSLDITPLSLGLTVLDLVVDGRNQQRVSVQVATAIQEFFPAAPLVGVRFAEDVPTAALSAPVGVRLASDAAQPAVSKAVGVRIASEADRPASAKPVGVRVGSDGDRPAVAAPVGVRVGAIDSVLIGPFVGSIFGAVTSGLAPSILGLDASVDVLIAGYNLDEVTSVTLTPPDDLSIGALSSSADGRSLTVPVTVAAGAAPGSRTLTVTTPSGDVIGLAGSPLSLSITALAELSALAPATALPGTSFTLTVSGVNLQGASGLTFTPPEGITADTVPIVNANGTELSVEIAVDALANPGDRTVIVTTPLGDTSSLPTQANTLTVTP